MKLTMLFLSLLVITTTAAAAAEPVRDTSGEVLRQDGEYFILPAIHGNGGGLSLRVRFNTCPLAVAQEQAQVSNGLPVAFFPVAGSADGTVPLSTDLNIEFEVATICVQSTVWKIGDVGLEVGGGRLVVMGGVRGKPGPTTVNNWFKIERSGKFYKLVFCPSVCKDCDVVCGDLGLFSDGESSWLGLSDVPFLVKFEINRNTI